MLGFNYSLPVTSQMMYLKGKDQYFVVYLAPFLLDASLSEEKKRKEKMQLCVPSKDN